MKFKSNSKPTYPIPTFERFADVCLNELFNKIQTAQEILTLKNFSNNLDFKDIKKT